MAANEYPGSSGTGAKIGVKTGDSKELQEIDRIIAWAFHVAQGEKPGTISRKWVARFLKRDESWVKRNWNKNPYAKLEKREDDDEDQRALSQESKTIIRDMLTRPKKQSVRELRVEVDKKRRKRHSVSAVYRFLKEEKARAFHVVCVPRISPLCRENRLAFCDLLSDWDENDFMYLAPSDEFFIYAERRPNYQNDRIWALSLEDIAYEDRVREKAKFPCCIGVFLCFTAKKMMWVLKEKGQSWDGAYFRQILTDNIIPFLKNRENVIDVKQTTFLHDKAPCMKALATQQLLINNNVDFFSNTQWPGSSPDLNVAENVGAILKDRTEEELLKHPSSDRIKPKILSSTLNKVLRSLENDTDLFERLLRSYPTRLAEVRKMNGFATKY